MRKIYRVKTMYHLLLVLLLIDENEENILYIESEDMFYLKLNLVKVGFFKKIYTIKNKNNTFIRYIKTILNALLYKILNNFYVRNSIIVTPQHNIMNIRLLFEYISSSKVIILEDGFSSYVRIHDYVPNSLFLIHKKESFIKYLLGDYFINIYNEKISKFVYVYPDKLKLKLPDEYNTIKEKIYHFNIEEKIYQLSKVKKDKIKQIFFNKNFNFNFGTNKTAILLTQPLIEDGKINIDEMNELIKEFEDILKQYSKKGYTILIKQHPREIGDRYKNLIKNFSIIEINRYFPFELILIFYNSFDVGITYYSTIIYSSLFKEKIILRKEIL